MNDRRKPCRKTDCKVFSQTIGDDLQQMQKTNAIRLSSEKIKKYFEKRKGVTMKFFSMKLLALLSVAMVVYSAPAISANVPAIAASFPEVDAVYVGLLTTIPSLFLLLGIFTTSMIEKRIGKKYTMVTGLVIVAIFGTLPAWYQGSFARRTASED